MFSVNLRHGSYSCSGAQMDDAIASYLPSSVKALREEILSRANGPMLTSSEPLLFVFAAALADEVVEIHTVSELLVILAEIDRLDRRVAAMTRTL